jgi:hypothetical protein
VTKDGILFAFRKTMSPICHHCDEPIVGEAYRVRSEESGVTLLDMMVCYFCYLEARRLGLPAQRINLEASYSKARYGVA